MSLVGNFAHLPNLPRSEEARPLLEKVASQVKPIMSKRGWKVGTLGEFVPQNPSLLGININKGQRINLRLRPPGNLSTFYEYDQLVLVMLHELTHIVHEPHDAAFYKLLSELEEEYYSLKQKGYSGEGFHSNGKVLNGIRRNEYDGKRRGLAAAEKRLNAQRTLGRGGVLGGSSVSGKSLRELVAEAAERRIKDDTVCKIDGEEALEEDRKAIEQSTVTAANTLGSHAHEVVDLTQSDDSDDGAGPSRTSVTHVGASRSSSAAAPAETSDSAVVSISGSLGTAVPNNMESSTNAATSTSRRRALPVTQPVAEPPVTTSGDTWECGTCTLVNPKSAANCEACLTTRPRPKRTADGWFCDFCGTGPREMGFWSCTECGWVRNWG